MDRSRLDRSSQRGHHRRGSPWPRAAAILAAIMVAGVLALLSGRGCIRPTERDFGLRDIEEHESMQAGGNRAGTADSGGDGTGNGSGKGSGAGSSAGQGGGEGEGQGGSGTGTGMEGTGRGGTGADGAGAHAAAGGGPAADGGTVAGIRSGSDTGAASQATESPAALPGRPRPKPQYDAATAAEVADRHLRRASTLRNAGDVGNAYGEALQAFEAVTPHAASDAACKTALARAKGMLRDLAESLNREPRPTHTPSYLE